MPSVLPSPDNDYQAPPSPARFVFDRAVYNHLFGSLGIRLRALEAKRVELQDVIDDLRMFGLERLDTAIVPLIEQTQVEIDILQQQIATQTAIINQLLEDFQADATAALAGLQAQIGAATEALEADISALQGQVDTILAGGIPAANVVESGARVFLTPAQRTEIATLRADLATAQAAISAVSYSQVRPLVWTVGNVSVGAGQRVRFNTASAAGQATLPASPATGDTIDVSRAGANIVTIVRNGKTIGGVAENLILDTDLVGVTLEFCNGGWDARGWRFVR